MRPNLINRLKEEWNNLDPVDPLRGLLADAIDALTQPAQQQELVAWTDEQLQMLNFLYGSGDFDGVWFDQKHPAEKGAFWWRKHLRRLFTSPPASKPLTDEQIKLVMDGRGEEGDDDYVKPAFDPFGISEEDLMNFARAIEAAHGIKGDA